jgi:hypothetical protein
MNAAGLRDSQSLDKGLVYLFVEYVSGATGAIATINRSTGISAVTRTGVGTVDVVLNEAAFSLFGASGEIRQVAFTNTNGCYVNQKTDNVATPGTNLAKVTFEHRACAGSSALADTTTGDVVQYYIVVGTLAP